MTKDETEQAEIILAVIDEHMGRIEHCLSTVDHSLARIRALSSDLKALTGAQCFAAKIKELEGMRHRGEFGPLYIPTKDEAPRH